MPFKAYFIGIALLNPLHRNWHGATAVTILAGGTGLVVFLTSTSIR